MPDTADWKQKYRGLLLESEAQEKRWRHVEKVLRHLVGRLCAAGMGVHERLDEQLAVVAAANRRNAGVDELEALVDELTGAVTAVDLVAPVFAKQAERWSAACAAAGAILARLGAGEARNPELEALRAALTGVRSDGDLAAVLLRTADLIAAQRLQTAAVLANVGRRLGEMAEYLAASAEANRAGFEDTETVNTSVMSQVRELSQETRVATNLAELQRLVDARLESVGASMHEFRSRAEQRLAEQTASTEAMRARVDGLEREARELQQKLDEERDRARVDPLTNIANRQAFDERLAEQLARMDQAGAASALLLWDVDDFKAINDSYGHRAGDRVLRTVARCLAGALRTTDFVARIGGEEFASLLTDLNLESAMRVAEDLRAAVEALRFHVRGTPVRVTVSCGLAATKAGDTPVSLFDRADGALYRAKSAGKNLCVAG